MTRIYDTPFADVGDRDAIEDDVQPDGKMSNPEGWTPDYEKLQSDPDYRPVGRKEMNGVLYEISQAPGELQEHGFALWQAREWPEGSIVVHNGQIYKATTATTDEPPGGDWGPFFVFAPNEQVWDGGIEDDVDDAAVTPESFWHGVLNWHQYTHAIVLPNESDERSREGGIYLTSQVTFDGYGKAALASIVSSRQTRIVVAYYNNQE